MAVNNNGSSEPFGLDATLQEILQQALAGVGGEQGLIVEFPPEPAGYRLCAYAGCPPEAYASTLAALLEWERGRTRGAEAAGGGDLMYVIRLAAPAGQADGAILLDRRPADPAAEQLLDTLAKVARRCISQARLYEGERKRRALAETLAQAERMRLDEISAFNNMARAITSMLDPDDILHFIMDQAQSLFNAEAASVALLDPEGEQLSFQVAVGAGAAGTIGHTVRLGQGVAGWVAQTGESVRVADTAKDERWYAGVDKKTGFFTRNLMCVPLVVEDRVIGVVEIINRREHTFDENDLHLLEAVGAQVGAAMKNARLFRETRRRAEELSTLLETGQAITSTLDLASLLEAIGAHAHRSLTADGCVLYLLDSQRGLLNPVVALGNYADEVLSAPVPLSQGLSGWVVRHGAGRIMNAAHLDPLAFLVPGTPLEPESLLGVPLQTKGETIGVMTVSRSGNRFFVDDDLRFLTSLATQASIALVNARLYEAARDNAARLAALQEVAKAINSSLDLTAIMQTLIKHIGRLVPHQKFALGLYDAQRDVFERHVPAGAIGEKEPTETEAGWMRLALEQGVPITKEIVEPAAGAEAAYSIIAVPITAEQRKLGAVLLTDSRPGGFSVMETAILAELANHLALAIQNARLYQERDRAYRDLAEAQQQLVLNEKLRALGQMASGIAHNFNNVLAVVLGRAQLAMRRVTDDGLQHDLEAIVRAARDGATIVRRLQEFTRLRPDEKALQLIDPNDVITSVAEITRPRWKDQMDAEGRSVTLVTETSAVPRVAGNPAELREVLTNMIFNALDAMPRGGNITMRVGQERNFVTISMQDTGVGMTDEVRSRIFEPFFTTKGPQNSGLGLSTSYGIIARHGGEIRVESKTGQGSTFTIALPVAQDRAPAEERREAQQPPQPSRILLIDDEAELCRIIQRALEGQGHHVSAFTVAGEALAAFRAAPTGFDLIITDLGMPAISGWDLSAAIRTANLQVPIVMITGWGDHLDNHLTQQYHIASVLAKPFDIEELLQLATRVLRAKH